MNHTELELFVHLLSCKSLSEAAAKMALSQPRASQMLQRLEREMGCKLFERSHVGLGPTAAAQAFKPLAEQMLSARQVGMRVAREACEGMYGSLNVGVSHTASAFTVPFIMRDFHETYPHVRLTLTKALPHQLLIGMETDALDICLVFKPARTAPFVWETLFETDLVGIYSPSFEGEVKPELRSFAQLPLVLPSRHCSSRVVLDTELQKLGIVPSIVMEIDDSGSLNSMVRHGTVVSIVPRTMVKVSRHMKLVALRGPQVFAEAGIMSKRNPSKVSVAFADLVRKQIALRLGSDTRSLMETGSPVQE